MGYKNKKGLITLALLIMAYSLPAQDKSEQADSLVRLLSATSIEQFEKGSDYFRKALSATFLHNGTYLSSDSSLWSENTNTITFYGNVTLTQGDTELKSETLDYLVDEDLAQFRGTLVELKDKKGNTLRTNFLDYNTKDSTAIFFSGASMLGEDGQIIESLKGQYFNALSVFRFNDNVNMFTDSVFVRTDSLLYDSDRKKAHFISYMDFFKDDNILSSRSGWFDQNEDIFFFRGDVHAQSNTREAWSDSLYYYRTPNNFLMLGKVQVQDSTRSTASLSDYLFYEDSLSQVTLKKQAAIALWEEKDGKRDTTYLGAESIVYKGIKYCDIDSLELVASEKRKTAIKSDPIAEFRRRASEEAAKKAAQAQKDSDKEKGKPVAGASKNSSAKDTTTSAVRDSVANNSVVADTVAKESVAKDSIAIDSIAKDSVVTDSVVTDSLIVEALPDTTNYGLITATHKVKVFRKDIQIDCDSLIFNQLDSIARFYVDPLVWNEGRRQYSADSLFVLIDSVGVNRASLMGNAFISVQEDTIYYDQIRSAEIMAYFDSTTVLKRFDALGGVNAIFCLEEKEIIATINKVESRTLTADLKDGELQNSYYFESPKNDAIPVAQLQESDRRLKGFRWDPERQPRSKDDITSLTIRPSERNKYLRHPKADFKETERYFPGHIQALYASLEAQRLARQEPSEPQTQVADTIEVTKDTIAVKDSIKTAVDSLVTETTAPTDSLSNSEEDYMTPAELRRAMRIARRDARWAEQDKRDAERAAAKQARKEQREAAKAKKAQERRKKQYEREQKTLQYYIDYFKKQIERDERTKEPEPPGERTQGVESGGGVQTPIELKPESDGSNSLLRDNGSADDNLIQRSSSLPRT